MTEIRVPTLGESVTEATIGRWFKKAGEAVAVDEPLVELETDKVTVEVPAPVGGVLSEIKAKDGDTVAVGDTVHVASRFQDLTKHYQAQLIISEKVAARAGVDASAFPRHEITVRNRLEILAIRVE